MSTSAKPAEGQPAQSPGLVVGAMVTVLVLGALGQTVVSTALPTIVADLGGLDRLSWVVTAYLLASTIVAPIYGKLGDLFGRKIVLQSSIVLFLVGAIGSGFSANMTELIAARAVQGLGGGGLIVLAMTAVADVISPEHRGRIQGMLAAVFGISTVIGPLLGGFIVDHVSWQWIFFLNIPIGLVALGVITATLKSPRTRRSARIDYLGAVLLTLGLTCVVLFTSLGGNTLGWTSPPLIAIGVAAIVFLAGFVYTEKRVDEPLLDLTLFGNRTFTNSCAVLFVSGFCMFGSTNFVPLFMQTVGGISPSQSGLQMLPIMIGMFGTSIIAGQMMSRFGKFRWMPITGSLFLAVALSLFATMNSATSHLLIVVYALLLGIGLGLINSVLVTAVQNAVPREQLGVGTAGTTLFRQIGGSIGVSVFGAIFANRLGAEMGSAMPEGGTSSLFNHAALVAMSEEARTALLTAIADAMHPAFLTGAALAVVAFAIAVLLVEVPLSAASRKEPDAEIKAEEDSAAAAAGAPV